MMGFNADVCARRIGRSDIERSKSKNGWIVKTLCYKEPASIETPTSLTTHSFRHTGT